MLSRVFVDIGNTNTKWKFEGDYFFSSTDNFEIEKLPKCSKIWVSSVSTRSFELNNPDIKLAESQARYKSLTNIYKDPSLLGCDRWLGMIASYEISQQNSFILIDIGTAITIDIVDKFGIHQGGLIFPGLDKLRQTFNNFPVSSIENINEIGQTTEKAWSIGTLVLVVNAINQKINELKNETPNVSIFITGGGYVHVNDFLEFDHVYYPHLVLDGLEFYVDNMG